LVVAVVGALPVPAAGALAGQAGEGAGSDAAAGGAAPPTPAAPLAVAPAAPATFNHPGGAEPKSPPGRPKTGDALVKYWYGQKNPAEGQAQETCRDFGHTGWGLEGFAHVAETARLQGMDLYGEMQQRMTAALEFHAGLDLGRPVPSSACGGTVNRGLGPVLEVAYNHYHNRKGIALPKTQRLMERGRPAGTSHFLAWETLTHAGNP
jgi:hypothetical protein